MGIFLSKHQRINIFKYKMHKTSSLCILIAPKRFIYLINLNSINEVTKVNRIKTVFIKIKYLYFKWLYFILTISKNNYVHIVNY
ncbi:MAG: hypothetical protein GAK29_05018 [Acinetobacter bereziniae]|uniref:Uncharacterized protein n=1 Tax=Acinetobacter bereziniae TaxID=106648 RepID=A0A833U8L2_ACIBZ|nr:MAG: hypothetical protein GAK29_05018 [Acinetobacter bereziniae]